jgi:hypothetical protein
LITAFAKEFAKRGHADVVLGEIKRKLHERTLEVIEETAYTPRDIQLILNFLKNGPVLKTKTKQIAKL